MLDKLVSH